MRALIPILCFTLLAGIVVASPARANLLVNGSFETWSGGDLSSASSQPDRIFNDGSLSVPGWNFAIGLSSDLYRDLAATGAQSASYDAADGDYLAASGSFDPLHEGISQTFVVTPNMGYVVTFQMAPGGLDYSGSWIEHALVGSSWRVEITGAVAVAVDQSFNTNLADFNATGTTNPLNWSPKLLTFASDSAGGNVTLRFTAYGDMTHVFLDNVVVTPEEPTAGEAWSWGRMKALYR
jgi:hypothetical protein